ncbi:hypothetical protein SPRG_03574 [Saprolegnia parasitica CBS 223.65]|uniref:Uncharacterized protein n=1 Tax=Saprolegnia parasitica (strain CBS 223.65) TaxID=695850 RepID=A0A067CLT6_SAPPC|nr:hypothetical protein SPRG_03574 [Saprolegnia parasitica CBS 223.65]KDO31654.1 hypothetical protein SPRG_03574 [Saprolegnia parasitica CBS 223.65]|eukprot:XP_012197544.1 hypothetical protein SPRG_03574 [Saprolegnia parasitica CBS 223.65]
MDKPRWSQGRAPPKMSDAKKVRKVEIPFSATAASQWKQLRQTVSAAHPEATARAAIAPVRIGDLCSEDKHKVGKLVRQLIKVSGENDAKRCELQDLSAKHADLQHRHQDLESKLNQALEVIQTYQTRMQGLQKKSEREQLQLEHALDALDGCHVELAALREEIARHDDARAQIEASRRHEVQQLRLELDALRQELELERSKRQEMTSQYDTMAKVLGTSTLQTVRLTRGSQEHERLHQSLEHSIDLSSLLNVTSTPDANVQRIVQAWKSRLEGALLTPETGAQRLVFGSENRQDVGTQWETRGLLREVGCNTEDIDPSLRQQQHHLYEGRSETQTPVLPPSLVDSEFYELSLFELVSALEEHSTEPRRSPRRVLETTQRPRAKWANSYFDGLAPIGAGLSGDVGRVSQGPLSAEELSIRDAVEADMQEMLSDASFVLCDLNRQ